MRKQGRAAMLRANRSGSGKRRHNRYNPNAPDWLAVHRPMSMRSILGLGASIDPAKARTATAAMAMAILNQ